MDNELPPIDYHMLARIAKNRPQSLIKPGLSIRKSKRLMTKRAEHTIRAVLETSVLIKKPELIARRIVGFELIIPHAAEKSLKRRRRGESQPDMPLDVLPTTAFMHLINAAKHHKIITAGYIPAKYRSTSSARYHSQTKSGILEYLEYLKKESEPSGPLLFVSDDQYLAQWANHIGVARATIWSFPPKKAQFEDWVPEVKSLVGAVRLSESFKLIIGVLAGLFVAGFYAVSIFTPNTVRFLHRFPNWFLAVLFVAAGIYIIVRGLDNIGKGLEGTILEVSWKNFKRATWLIGRRQRLVARDRNRN